MSTLPINVTADDWAEGSTTTTGAHFLQQGGPVALTQATTKPLTPINETALCGMLRVGGVAVYGPLPAGEKIYLRAYRLPALITNTSEDKGLTIEVVVAYGASIMAQTFGGAGEATTEALFAAQGATVSVHNRATSGDNSTDMLANLPAVLAEFAGNAANTLIAMHGPGNDVSASGPYPGGATLMESNMRQICEDIKAAGFRLAMSDITYRIPPASNPTAPYNENVISPLIDEFADIRLGLHKLSFDNVPDWHEVDGTHPNGFGEDLNRNYLVDTTVPFFSNIGAIPQPIEWEDVVLQFGLLDVYPDGSNAISINTTRAPIKNVDLSVVAGASVTLSGSGGHSDTLGRGNVNDPSDTSISLTNNKGLLSYVYMQNGTIAVDLSGANLDPLATYDVSATASRDAVDARNVDMVVDGVTEVLLATASPAEIVSWSAVSGAALMASGLTATANPAGGYAYIGMIRIIKN